MALKQRERLTRGSPLTTQYSKAGSGFYEAYCILYLHRQDWFCLIFLSADILKHLDNHNISFRNTWGEEPHNDATPSHGGRHFDRRIRIFSILLPQPANLMHAHFPCHITRLYSTSLPISPHYASLTRTLSTPGRTDEGRQFFKDLTHFWVLCMFPSQVTQCVASGREGHAG